MAHRLYNSPDTKCFVPHGHNEVVTVTLLATNNKRLDGKENIVERFSKAKKLWHEWIDNYLKYYNMKKEEFDLVLDKYVNKKLFKKINGIWEPKFIVGKNFAHEDSDH